MKIRKRGVRNKSRERRNYDECNGREGTGSVI